jgi:peptidoglycan/xylan/chitin deacetylase (PgdA/CDA1 family)
VERTLVKHEALFHGPRFGSFDEWRAVSEGGHDVQPHSVSHVNFASLTPEQQCAEIVGSAEMVRGIHQGRLIFAFPYNVIPNLDLPRLGLSASGFVTRTSDGPAFFNDLGAGLDLFRLRSWAVRERHLEAIATQLTSLPDRSWTILAFHSLDGEGHEPWSSLAFHDLVDLVRRAGLDIVTISEMIGAVLEADAVRRHRPSMSR